MQEPCWPLAAADPISRRPPDTHRRKGGQPNDNTTAQAAAWTLHAPRRPFLEQDTRSHFPWTPNTSNQGLLYSPISWSLPVPGSSCAPRTTPPMDRRLPEGMHFRSADHPWTAAWFLLAADAGFWVDTLITARQGHAESHDTSKGLIGDAA